MGGYVLKWVWIVCFETSEWNDWLGSVMISNDCLLDTWLKNMGWREVVMIVVVVEVRR